ncbi:MAG: hypothetical protein M9962_04135 [Oligoflexia bacterium]|nr:hypothetical protein [Oligoflexia bacterium]
MILLLLSLLTSSLAISNDPILGDAPPVEANDGEQGSNLENVFSEPAKKYAEAVKEEIIYDHTFRFKFGMGLKKYNLASSGFKATLPAERSIFLGVDWDFPIENLGWIKSIDLVAEYGQYTFDNLRGLNRASINSKEYLLELNPKMYFSNSSDYYLLLGYRFYSRSSEHSTPNELISSLNSHSVLFGLGGKEEIGNRFYLEGKLKASVPFDYKEKQASSGSYRQSFRMTPELHLVKRFENLFLSIGTEYNFSWTKFNGSGARGTIDAKEIENEIRVPLGVGWKF